MENKVCKAIRICGMTILILGCLFGIISLIQGLNLMSYEETLKTIKITTGVISIISSIVTWVGCAWLYEMLQNSIQQTENSANIISKINELKNIIEKQK